MAWLRARNEKIERAIDFNIQDMIKRNDKPDLLAERRNECKAKNARKEMYVQSDPSEVRSQKPLQKEFQQIYIPDPRVICVRCEDCQDAPP